MREDKGVILLGASALDRHAYRLLLEQEVVLNITADCDFTPLSLWTGLRSSPALAVVLADRMLAEAREAVQMIARTRPKTQALIVSEIVDAHVLRSWGRCRILGYVNKRGGVDELRQALDEVLDGRFYFSEGLAAIVQQGCERGLTKPKLSRRESDLLPLLARGMTLREAASKLSISYKTADSYRTSLLKKLGVRGRVELARYAIRERIIDP